MAKIAKIALTRMLLGRFCGLPENIHVTKVELENDNLIILTVEGEGPPPTAGDDVYIAPQFEIRQMEKPGFGYEMWACWPHEPEKPWRVFPPFPIT